MRAGWPERSTLALAAAFVLLPGNAWAHAAASAGSAARFAALYLPGSSLVAANKPAGNSPGSSPVAPPRSGTKAPDARAPAPIYSATGTGPGQAGYVHFFIINKAGDAETETQVGIELADGRIAWSFPGLGVVISPFIASGTVQADGQAYDVEHQYGLRPWRDDRALLALQEALAGRVSPWVEKRVPYCELNSSKRDLCMSCLGFVMNILYPGPSPHFPALPADFKGGRMVTQYSTEDLLLYLAGMQGPATKQARVKHIEALQLPPALREELLRLVRAEEKPRGVVQAKSRAGAGASSKPGQPPAPAARKL
jgi:hypothetical protein